MTTGLTTFGDLSFLPFAVADVAVETFASFFAGWKRGLADGDPNTNVADVSRVVEVGLSKETSADLSSLFRLTPIY